MNIPTTTNKSRLFALTAGLAIAATSTMATSAQAATYNLDFNSGADGGSILYNNDGTLDTTQWESWGLTNITGTNNYNVRKKRNNGQARFNIYDTNGFTGRNNGGRDIDLTTGVFTGKSKTRKGITKTVKSNDQTLDTGVANQGGALIIQEESHKGSFKKGVYIADDEAKGGDVFFEFKEAVNFKSFSLLDIDDNGGGITVEGTRADGSILNIDIDEMMAQHHAMNGTTEGAQTKGTSVTVDGVKMTQVGYLQGDNSMFKFDIDDAHLTDVRFSYPGSGAISGMEWGVEPRDIPEPSAIGGLLMVGFIGKHLKKKRDEAVA